MVKVGQVRDEALGIRSYELIDPQGAALPRFTAGAHIDLHLGGKWIRSYSLCNDPHESHRYLIAVLREPESRGGSVFVHENLFEGSSVLVSDCRNKFPLAAGASHHILIAGGIGITPLLSMARHLQAVGGNYTLHYCVRSPERAAFYKELTTPPFDWATIMHFDGGNPRHGLEAASLLRRQMEGQHVYCCGPAGLMNAVKAATVSWAPGTVHFENFKPDSNAAKDAIPNSSFEIEIASTGQICVVPPDKTILQVLREHGISHKSSCEEGVCGTCATGLLAGKAEHRDLILSDEEKASQTVLMVCCSRAATKRLKLDL